MRSKTSWWVLAFLLALAAPVEARHGQFDLLRQTSDTARLIVERSRVYWQSPDMAEPSLVDSAGQEVSSGDVLATDGLGRARLSLGANAVATVYHDTDLTLLGVPDRHLALDEGTLLVQASRTGAPFVIETTEGRVEATGRVLVHRIVDHRNNRNSTWVLVQSGQASVDGGGGQVTLGADQQTWVTNGGRPEKPLGAQRDLVGNQFFLIDDLTNGAIPDEELLAPDPITPPSSFPLALVLTIGAVAMVGVLIVLGMRSRPGTAVPAHPQAPAPKVGVAPATLLIAGVEGQGRQMSIHDVLAIGRAPDNHLPIADPMVSSHHARIFAQGGEFVIEDLNSRNGTFVNDQRVTTQRLRSGDEIRIGQLTLVFQDAGAPQRAPKAPPAAAGQPQVGLRLAQGDFIALQGPALTIGRAPDSQVVIADQQASAHHARLAVEPAGIAIEDLGSTNGTFVNGRQVDRQLLAPGDRIRIGQTELEFQIESGQEVVS